MSVPLELTLEEVRALALAVSAIRIADVPLDRYIALHTAYTKLKQAHEDLLNDEHE